MEETGPFGMKISTAKKKASPKLTLLFAVDRSRREAASLELFSHRLQYHRLPSSGKKTMSAKFASFSSKELHLFAGYRASGPDRFRLLLWLQARMHHRQSR